MITPRAGHPRPATELDAPVPPVKLSRRTLLAAVPLGLAAAGLAGCAPGDEDGDHPVGLLGGTNLWDIPDAAWRRALGSHPPGSTGTVSPLGTQVKPVSRTKRGIPVGGIGTGSFMLNLSGSFGPWHFDIGGDDSAGTRWGSPRNGGFEDRYLSQAAFHVSLTTGAGTVTTALATEDLLPAWPLLETGEGLYAALFPKAWFVYQELPLPVALKQLTPFVARDDRRSSLPGGLFQLAVSNPTNAPARVSCMLSFPNAPYRLPTAQYQYTRQGLRSSLVRGPGTIGVRLQAQDKDNVPETERTEWVIVARGPSGSALSATEDWAGDGDGLDLLAAFKTGQLPDRPLDTRRLGLAGAVCVSFTLAPGEQRAATFALAWDFPVVQFRNPVNGTKWRKRYTQWYPGSYRGWAIASDLLADASRPRTGHQRVVEAGGRRSGLSLVVARRRAQRALLRRLRWGLLGERMHHQAQAVRGAARPAPLLHLGDRRLSGLRVDGRPALRSPASARTVPHHRARRVAGMGRHGDGRSHGPHPP